MAAYNSSKLITNVRALLNNISSARITDPELLTFAHHALSILHVHRPAPITVSIDGSGKSNYRVDNLVGWQSDFSTIQSIAYGADLSADELPIAINDDTYQTYGPTVDGQLWLIFENGPIPTSKSVLLQFTGIWKVAGIDDAAVTTLVNPALISAFEYLTAYNVCLTLSAAAASFVTQGIPGDVIDYGNRRMEYKEAADQFYQQFQIYLNMVPMLSIPVGGFYATNTADTDDWPAPITHFRSRRG